MDYRYNIDKSLIYILIFTLVSSAFAYAIVVRAYDSFYPDYISEYEGL